MHGQNHINEEEYFACISGRFLILLNYAAKNVR